MCDNFQSIDIGVSQLRPHYLTSTENIQRQVAIVPGEVTKDLLFLLLTGQSFGSIQVQRELMRRLCLAGKKIFRKSSMTRSPSISVYSLIALRLTIAGIIFRRFNVLFPVYAFPRSCLLWRLFRGILFLRQYRQHLA
jgi:hypothetical protein